MSEPHRPDHVAVESYGEGHLGEGPRLGPVRTRRRPDAKSPMAIGEPAGEQQSESHLAGANEPSDAVPVEAQDPAASVGASYEVGYRKPPRHTQFKPGQSGNPKGRPRQS